VNDKKIKYNFYGRNIPIKNLDFSRLIYALMRILILLDKILRAIVHANNVISRAEKGAKEIAHNFHV